LNQGEFRLLEVDNFVKLPIHFPIRCLVFSSDVIHSWTVPSLMVKIDANPNQINSVYLKSLMNGLHYGQCSEICGINHRFIPIKLEFTSPLLFNLWLLS
jgi:heme/copper-type cytochrome/quinol oxidase subunit 2